MSRIVSLMAFCSMILMSTHIEAGPPVFLNFGPGGLSVSTYGRDFSGTIFFGQGSPRVYGSVYGGGFGGGSSFNNSGYNRGRQPIYDGSSYSPPVQYLPRQVRQVYYGRGSNNRHRRHHH